MICRNLQTFRKCVRAFANGSSNARVCFVCKRFANVCALFCKRFATIPMHWQAVRTSLFFFLYSQRIYQSPIKTKSVCKPFAFPSHGLQTFVARPAKMCALLREHFAGVSVFCKRSAKVAFANGSHMFFVVRPIHNILRALQTARGSSHLVVQRFANALLLFVNGLHMFAFRSQALRQSPVQVFVVCRGRANCVQLVRASWRLLGVLGARGLVPGLLRACLGFSWAILFSPGAPLGPCGSS